MQSGDRFGNSLIILLQERIAPGMHSSDLGGIQEIILLKKPKHFCAATLLSAGSIHLSLCLNPNGKRREQSWSLQTEADCFQSPASARSQFRDLNGSRLIQLLCMSPNQS